MNQFLSNKIIAGIVALALLVGVGVLISSGDTSSTTRNAALVVATPCTKPGQVTKVSKQSVVCATTNTGSLWYATMKAKGKAQPCTTPGAIRKKSKIVWVCGVVKKKKLWQATQPLPPAVVASTTGIEPGASQPTPALDSTQVAAPEAPVVADNKDLADTKIPEDKIVTQVIEDATTPPTCATGGTCAIGDAGPGGGIVFYVAATPQTWGTYLEAAPTDYQVNGSRAQVGWGCQGTSTGATTTAIGTGKANTATILATCRETGIAADVANKYSTTNTAGAPGAAGQWFLPSRDELNELCKIYSNGRTDTYAYSAYQNGCTGKLVPTGGFAAGYYWSSSEDYAYGANVAWGLDFSNGYQDRNGKHRTFYVRPVRAFSATMPATVAPKVCTGNSDCNLRDIGPGGGIVFYVAPTGFACEEDLDTFCRYLEAAITNGIGSSTWTPTTTAQWGCKDTLLAGTSDEIGAGRRNTKIITSRNCVGTDSSVSAASVAAAYNGGNTTDWYLPSRKELDALCNEFFKGSTANKSAKDSCLGSGNPAVVTGSTNGISWSFAAGLYWSSSENNSSAALFQIFSTGYQGPNGKDAASYVRPVRAF